MFNNNQIILLKKENYKEFKSDIDAIFEENYYKNGGMLYSTDFLENSEFILLYKENDAILAYMAITHFKKENIDREYEIYYEEPNTKNSLYIKQLCVKEKHRSKGIAKALFVYLKDYCAKNNIKFIYLWTTSNNDKAISLYEKQGFYKMGEFFDNKRFFKDVQDYHSIMLVCKL